MEDFKNLQIIGADSAAVERLRSELNITRQDSPSSKKIDDALQRAARFGGDNQRTTTRYELSIPAVLYPVLATGEIDVPSPTPAVLADASTGGLKLWVEAPRPQTGREMLVGIETANGQLAYYGVRIVGTAYNSNRLFEINAAFEGTLSDMLQQDIIFPQLDRTDMKYRLPAPEPVLKSLCAAGAANWVALDHVSLCPDCRAIPTVRNGCGMCLSSHVKAQKMIHHYACANVDFVEKFEFDNEIACQKCRCRNMIVGADFEYLDGPNRCMDCGQANLELIQIGHCLCCGNRFSMENARVEELIGYRVSRLDILDVIHTA